MPHLEGRRDLVRVLTLMGLLLAACSLPSQTEAPFTLEPGAATQGSVPTPSPLPPPPKTLVVCLGREPDSLYLYSPVRL